VIYYSLAIINKSGIEQDWRNSKTFNFVSSIDSARLASWFAHNFIDDFSGRNHRLKEICDRKVYKLLTEVNINVF